MKKASLGILERKENGEERKGKKQFKNGGKMQVFELLKNIYEVPSVLLASYALENLENLSERELIILRREMRRRNFNSPFYFLVAMAKKENEEKYEKENADISKQMQIFRKIAMLKKLSLKYVSMALYCKKIKKTLSDEAEIREFADYLPFQGDYIKQLIKVHYNALMIYHELYNILSSHGEVKETHISLVDDAGLSYEIVTEKAMAYNLKEKERYKKIVIKPLLRNAIVRKILCSAAVNYGYSSLLNSFHESDDELIRYNETLIKFGISPYSRLDNIEEKENVKMELEKQGFGTFDEFYFKTKESLLNKIIERRRFFYSFMRQKAFSYVYKIIKTSYEKGLRFPSMPKNPTENQLKVIEILKETANFGVENGI
jgi:hypothetical protein